MSNGEARERGRAGVARKTGSRIEEWQVVARCRVRTREGGCKDWGGRRSHKKGRERGSGTEERGQGRKKREVGKGRGRWQHLIVTRIEIK